MLDLRTMTHNGTAVAYATLPMYMLNAVLQQDKLTPAAKLVFIRLMAYASAVNTSTFAITVAWVAKNTGLCRKTVATALAALTTQGYVNANGIVFSAPPEKTQRIVVKQSLTSEPRKSPRPQPSVQVDLFPNATKMVEPDITPADIEIDLGIDLEAGLGFDLNVDCDIDQLPNPSLDIDLTLDETTDIGSQLNDMLRSLGSTKRVEKISQPVSKNFPQVGKNYSLYINNLNKQSEIKHSSTQNKKSVTVVGVLPSTSPRGFVEKTKPKPLARFFQSVSVGKPKPTQLTAQHQSYVAKALQRMNVSSSSERSRYQSEIAYAATQGAFSETYSHTPLKAIRACLNLVEAGRWKPNVGMY